MNVVVGVDEVGRGCWAGPLVAGAAILHKPIDGLRDSKKLSAKQRAQFAELIHASASVGLGWVTAQEIDELGLTESVSLAMQRAIDQITHVYDQIIIDGNFNFLAHDDRTSTLIHGDDLVPAISAASIIAKVARDNFMVKAAQDYVGYGFDQHVGYGTKAHREALANFGPTKLHRLSFKPLKAYL